MWVPNGNLVKFLRTVKLISLMVPWFSFENLQFFRDDDEERMKEFWTFMLGIYRHFVDLNVSEVCIVYPI